MVADWPPMLEQPITPSHHEHVAGRGEIVRFGFALAARFVLRRFVDLRRVADVAHRERRADDALAAVHRRQLVGGDDADDAQFVEGIRNRAGQIDERLEAVDDFGGQARQLEHAYRFARQFAEGFLFSHGSFLPR